MNRLGQRGQTGLGWNTQAYAARARSFGWHAIEELGGDRQTTLEVQKPQPQAPLNPCNYQPTHYL